MIQNLNEKFPDIATLTKAEAKVEQQAADARDRAPRQAYYQDDAPKVSDATTMSCASRFNAIEARFPEFISAGIGRRRRLVPRRREIQKVRHTVPMLSLDNAFAEKTWSTS